MEVPCEDDSNLESLKKGHKHGKVVHKVIHKVVVKDHEKHKKKDKIKPKKDLKKVIHKGTHFIKDGKKKVFTKIIHKGKSADEDEVGLTREESAENDGQGKERNFNIDVLTKAQTNLLNYCETFF